MKCVTHPLSRCSATSNHTASEPPNSFIHALVQNGVILYCIQFSQEHLFAGHWSFEHQGQYTGVNLFLINFWERSFTFYILVHFFLIKFWAFRSNQLQRAFVPDQLLGAFLPGQLLGAIILGQMLRVYITSQHQAWHQISSQLWGHWFPANFLEPLYKV